MIMNNTIITQSGQTIKAGVQVPIIHGMLVSSSQVLHDDWWQTFEVTKPMTWSDQVVRTVFTPLQTDINVPREVNLGDA